MSRLLRRFLLTALAVHLALPFTRGEASFQHNALSAVETLQKWYNKNTGLYETTGWWNSANCITVLAHLAEIDNQGSKVVRPVWENTFEKAQKFNLRQAKTPNNCPTTICTRQRYGLIAEQDGYAFHGSDSTVIGKRETTLVDGVQYEDVDPKGFLNGFFDDEAWWALAWSKVFDLTKDQRYIRATSDLFEDISKQGGNAICGGVWWDRKRTANTAISNELALSVAAHLANRVPEKKDYYLSWAVKQWEWFERSKMINENNQINDGLDLRTCKNDRKDVWSYNQGVILGALIELNKALPNETFIHRAADIATAAIRRMTDRDGILHDPRDPNIGGDGHQFKGVFVRNLKDLYKVTRNDLFKDFLQRNADSVWRNARNQANGIITSAWSGPFDDKHASAATHSSGLDALVAAAAVQ